MAVSLGFHIILSCFDAGTRNDPEQNLGLPELGTLAAHPKVRAQRQF
jgi:hypothetical protein